MDELTARERPADGAPSGLLVLCHGRGSDESELLLLGEALDPHHRLHLVTPRGPLTLSGWKGFHWYRVSSVGHPDPETFHAARRSLAALHDRLWRQTGLAPSQTVLGGFSMGAVMSYALGLDEGRPQPAGILALSGFMPDVPGWAPDPAGRRGLPVFVSHGRADPVIDVEFGRAARDTLEAGGQSVDYHETDGSHRVQPSQLPLAQAWMESALARSAGARAHASD
jgi:phospholipase/carboxylesterase